MFAGEPVDGLTPALAQDLGIAIVHQHPALFPDLTVAENLLVAVGREHLRRRDPDARGDALAARRRALRAHLEDRVSSLSVARRHLLELAKAFAVAPRLLILDEPTAPLSQDSVERLFTAVRQLAADGHGGGLHHPPAGRGPRDRGPRHRPARRPAPGTSAVTDITDEELLAMIIGRTLEATFPPKHAPAAAAPLLQVEGLSGNGFDNISFSARQGRDRRDRRRRRQRPAGAPARPGRARQGDRVGQCQRQDLSRRALLQSAAYMPADRLTEGLMTDLNVRENAAHDRARLAHAAARS